MPHRKVVVQQKPKNFGAAVKFVWGYLRRRKSALFLAAVMVLLNIGASLAGTAMLQPIIDNFLEPVVAIPVAARFAGLFKGIITLLCIYLVAVCASYLQTRLMLTVTQRSINDLRRELFDHLQDLSVRYYDTHTHGEMMSRFSNDVDTLNDALANSLTSLFSSVITLAGILGLMLSKSIPLTILTLLMTPLMFFVAGRLMKVSSKYFIAQQANLGKVNGYVEEIITGQKVVKVFCHEQDALEEFDRLNGELQEAATTAQSYSGLMMPVMMNISTVNYALVAAIGGILSIFGFISVGGLVVFLQLTRQFSRPINEASSQYNAVITAIAGAERIYEVMREPVEEPDPAHAADLVRDGHAFYWQCYRDDGAPAERVPVRGDVRFEDVTFGYAPEKTVLRHISLYAKPGQKIAFVGSTGAGKTTVTNLLTRFYDIAEGRITIDGIDIRQIKKDSLRRSLAMVLQDTHLFTGTVRDNIRYGRPDATDEEVEQAARLASAHSFIMRLPHGYDTVIEGDGANLSQGQRQLLNIARAACADAPILILDEATSSVDTRTERHIEHGLDRLMEGRTTFVIAHRLSTVRNSNAIMVLEQGEIIERGSHDDLLALHGRYYQLYTGVAELD
ncbi:ABC transporter ATP-binding protein [Anaerotruncus sp. DFI.9.16]|uniref:ABC transporter ATP-binding protein n=1 Tax=Anaerotruncus sp. DFI.9.16 TaxID=2965275 RepID=UPI00210EE482|nr:ABC transporter ATP-binding protein [Anaerotruncus sp. DFI.9.16]MCQ4895667.1 ABC transporter ATP-binding protein/permease [Anaerotruncus sp. DFI.9.16]